VPPDPCAGVTCPNKCTGYNLYSQKCVNGVCVNDALIEANSPTCGVVCTEGVKRSPSACWDGTTIHGEVCRGNEWVPTGETCPPKPECAEGDKKPGHVCVAGKWQKVTVPEPEVEPPVPEPEVEEKPCYIKCTLPILDMLPGIPCQPWLPILPGFKRSEEPQEMIL